MSIPEQVIRKIASAKTSLRQQLGVAIHSLATQIEKPAVRPPVTAMAKVETATPSAQEVARQIGDDWKVAAYYELAEAAMEPAWHELLFPLLKDCDFSAVLDLAAGHGRNSEYLRKYAQKIYVADINIENIEFCRRRFADDPRFEFVLCDGLTLPSIADASLTLLYCFDSMVHFDSDTVRAYLREFRRILRPGGRGLCHHSNYTAKPTGSLHDNPHWRNFMSQELFTHYCHKEGLRVIRSQLLDWGGSRFSNWGNDPLVVQNLDCVTVFERPE